LLSRLRMMFRNFRRNSCGKTDGTNSGLLICPTRRNAKPSGPTTRQATRRRWSWARQKTSWRIRRNQRRAGSSATAAPVERQYPGKPGKAGMPDGEAGVTPAKHESAHAGSFLDISCRHYSWILTFRLVLNLFFVFFVRFCVGRPIGIGPQGRI